MPFKATYLGSNGWVVQFEKIKIVIDPWIKGDLVFPLGEWFFKGRLEKEIPTPKNVNLILITQSLPDHCHIPSLDKFPKNIKVICPSSAYKLIKDIGFININTISPSEIIDFEHLKIEATSGAPVPNVENGYIIESKNGSLYIEPHGYFDKNIRPRKLDAVITPTKNLGLPIVGSFVKGADVVSELIEAFKPNYILSSTIGGDAKYSGLMNKFISVIDLNTELKCKLIDLKSLESINI